MQKFIRSRNFLYISLLVLILTIIPYKAHAIDISVGATTWYTWLEQPFASSFQAEEERGLESKKSGPGFLYGPVLSVKFSDDFNLTFVYLYGKFDIEKDNDEDIKHKLKRKDSDIALNYKLNNYFKVFGGLKYIGFNISPDREIVLGVDATGTIDSVKHDGYGPGFGLSATLPIADNIFLLGTVSGFYLWGKESKGFTCESVPPLNTPMFNKIKADCKDRGINSNLSIAYYIAPASTTISLGGRFQYIKTDKYKIKNGSVLTGDFRNYQMPDSSTTKFYGITLTATYSFGIF